MRLIDRLDECRILERNLSDVVDGRSTAIVLRGEAGSGKTALLEHVAERAVDAHLAVATGVESEMELAYSGLHQLCVTMLDHLELLPTPQRVAIEAVFGMRDSPAPDHLMVGLATLTLFAEVAEKQPLVCIVDDAQWLDQASARIVAFVARRLLAERVGIFCAARTGVGDDVMAQLPELVLAGLNDTDALTLLLDNMPGPIDAAICQRIVAESHGNPLAVLEFPRTWSTVELAGGLGLADGLPVTGKLEAGYVRRLRLLPSDTQLLVLVAAAEPVGDPVLLQRAAKLLDLDMAALDAAADGGLLTIDQHVRFVHPLVRSSVYRSAGTHDRHRVHGALADATDVERDPDRRAWHRARAARGPDEDVAADLERSAERAQARGGLAAVAAFLQKAVALTPDPTRRAERALAAAEASLQAGEFGEARQLVSIAEGEELDEFRRARVSLLRGRLAYVTDLDSASACPLLVSAAHRLEPFDPQLARETYLTAWFAATILGHEAGRDVMLEIARAVQETPREPGARLPLDLLLDGLVRLTTEGRVAAIPILRRAARELPGLPDADVMRWGWAAPVAHSVLWDDSGLQRVSARNLQIARAAGAFAQLPQYIHSFGVGRLWVGDLEAVEAVMHETEGIEAATGRHGRYLMPALLAFQGREEQASALINRVIAQAASPGRADEATPALWAAAVLYNGLARYEEARSAAQKATRNRFNVSFAVWALPELVEAAARTGDAELARDALERLAETTQPSGSDFALGIEARSRALISDSDRAELLYREAIERLETRQLRPDLARAHLLHGEWLRRQGRRADARTQLRAAHEIFTGIGMEAFAQRARRELLATGEKVGKRSPQKRIALTPQEEQIARLARAGLSNPEIGAQLFISARTVEWHLRNVFAKLGISTRRELRTALPEGLGYAGRI